MTHKTEKEKSRSNSFEEIIREINSKIENGQTLLIGIDGCGGSGKSTIADKIKEIFENTTIVHMDDFYYPSDKILKGLPQEKPIGSDFDWSRLYQQVILPIKEDKEGKYQRYDWNADELAEWYSVPTGGIVIIEGVYAMRKELFDLYNITIWVDCPRKVRLSRGIERDGENARDMWENNWMIAEDMYMQQQKTFEKAKFIINGTE